MLKPLYPLRLTVSIFLIFFVTAACNKTKKNTPQVLELDRMCAILTDIHLLEGAKKGRRVIGDTLRIETYYQKIFKKHHTSPKYFSFSFSYYAKHPDIMNTIYERVVENLNRMEVVSPKWDKEKDSVRVKKTGLEILKGNFVPVDSSILEPTTVNKDD